MATLLDALEAHLNVDVDSLSPTISTSIPFKPHDQTSNQLWALDEMTKPENRELVEGAVREYWVRGWEKVCDRICALLCARNIPNITGRVLLQVSCRFAYDKDEVISHAWSYVDELEKVGIPKSRVCIKIPSTGPALNAVCPLRESGIETLGTALFGLPQAIAAAQAGCLSISPYFNELRAHFDKSLWPDVADPAKDHPMSARIVHIVQTYTKLAKETGERMPLVKLASFLSAKEAMAAIELGCHAVTLPGPVLDALKSTPATSPPPSRPKDLPAYSNPPALPPHLQMLENTDPLASADWDGRLASPDVDYLVNNGELLDEAIHADPVTRERLGDALEAFVDAELKMQAFVEGVAHELGVEKKPVDV
ncbi:aldolase [Dacryopinax primogenitus]|uniref:Aldolase n=1 Tax=Dacryopinax primogenitus (strain DJM 731) TaxID=1858805 RepID=M5G473_DACPD|nr:aldolase [Dacryopinax primogenitus]EJT98552.1 aldolase [Dacryopinax primogenitus]